MRDFDKIIGRNALTLVYFFTPYCVACDAMDLAVDEFRWHKGGRADIYRINTDSAEAIHLLDRYKVQSTPTLLFFRHGEMLWRSDCAVSYEELCKVLERLESIPQPTSIFN